MADLTKLAAREMARWRGLVDAQIGLLPKSRKVEDLQTHLTRERKMIDTLLEKYAELVAILEDSVDQRDRMLAQFETLGMDTPQLQKRILN